jgi:hypothetical protein
MKIKISVISFFFCLMAILGMIAIDDSQKPVSLPIDGGFSIQGKTSKSNEELYQLINKVFNQKKVTIYKPIISSSGQTTYIKLNSAKDDVARNQSPIVGMYYTSGKLTSKDFEFLRSSGLQVIYGTYPWFLGGLTQFNGTLRLLLTLSLYMIIFITLLVHETRKLKERVIWRSLGVSIINIKEDIVIPFAFNLILATSLHCFYSSLIGNGFNTFSSKLFLALLLTNFLIFQVIDALVMLVIYVNVKFEKPVEIVKNKIKGAGLFWIWLGMIGAMILISGMVLKETKTNQLTLRSQIESLKPWQKVKTWQKLQLIGVEKPPSENGRMQEENFDAQYLKLLAAIKGMDFLYLQPSGVYLPENMKSQEIGESFEKQMKADGISQPEVNKQLIYTNQVGAQLENLVNHTAYQNTKGKIATIYIPKMFENAQTSLINTVLAEQFIGTTITKNELAVQIIPNGQRLFYFNEDGNDDQKNSEPFSRASDKNRIVVVLDTDWMIEQKDRTLAANIMNNGLFSPEAVGRIATLNQEADFSINPVTVYQTVALKVQSLKHQLLMAMILQKLLFLILLFCVYQYVKTRIATRQSDFVKMIILGRSKVKMAVSCLISLICLMMSVICLTVFLTGQTALFLLAASLLLILIISSIRSFRSLSKRYAQILKGELL